MVFSSWTFSDSLLNLIVTAQEGDESNYVKVMKIKKLILIQIIKQLILLFRMASGIWYIKAINS